MDQPTKLSEFLTLDEVAKAFGVPKHVVSRWRVTLGLPVIKLDARRYLVHEATLAAWLKSREQVRPALLKEVGLDAMTTILQEVQFTSSRARRGARRAS